jgi:hypothetical protein
MGVFAGTERQCIEDEHDDEDENDSQISEFGTNAIRHARLAAGKAGRFTYSEAKAGAFAYARGRLGRPCANLLEMLNVTRQ